MYITVAKHFLIKEFKNSLQSINNYIFFIFVIMLYGFIMQRQGNVGNLEVIAILWINAMMAFMMGVQSYFQHEFDSGMVEQWRCWPIAMEIILMTKLLCHWLVNSVALLMLVAGAGLLYDLSVSILAGMLVAMALSMLILLAIGTVGAAILVGGSRRSVLFMLLLCPFMMPLLVFGATISTNMSQGQGLAWAMLAGGACVMIPLTQWMSAYILRHSL